MKYNIQWYVLLFLLYRFEWIEKKKNEYIGSVRYWFSRQTHFFLLLWLIYFNPNSNHWERLWYFSFLSISMCGYCWCFWAIILHWNMDDQWVIWVYLPYKMKWEQWFKFTAELLLLTLTSRNYLKKKCNFKCIRHIRSLFFLLKITLCVRSVLYYINKL